MQQPDFLDELKELALGTRLKRLSEKMLADAARIYQQFDINLQPKWFSLLSLLNSRDSVTVMDAAKLLGVSQPAISQFCCQLCDRGLIESKPCKDDSRRRIMTLTILGKIQMTQMKPMCDAVNQAAKQLSSEFENDLYRAVQKCEQAFSRKSLLQRTMEIHNDSNNKHSRN